MFTSISKATLLMTAVVVLATTAKGQQDGKDGKVPTTLAPVTANPSTVKPTDKPTDMPTLGPNTKKPTTKPTLGPNTTTKKPKHPHGESLVYLLSLPGVYSLPLSSHTPLSPSPLPTEST